MASDWWRGWRAWTGASPGAGAGGRPAVIHADAVLRVCDEDGVRRLYLGAGSHTVQSAMRLNDPLHLELAYTRSMMAALLFQPQPREALLLGLGGGSLAKFLLARLPPCRVRVIESEPAVVAAARAHFALPADGQRLEVTVADAAVWLVSDCAPATVDLLLVDVYDAQRQVEACTSAGFFAAAARALTRDGVCAVNLWSNAAEYPRYRDRFLDAFAGRVLLLPAARPGNTIALGFAGSDGDWRWSSLHERARQLAQQHRLEFDAFVEALRHENPYTETRLLI
jgi:spermidine synthase